MNLATLALAVYLKNPADSAFDGGPRITLPNGKKIVIVQLETEIDWSIQGNEIAKTSSSGRKYVSYELRRDLGRGDFMYLGTFYDLDQVAAELAKQSQDKLIRARSFSSLR